MTARPLNPAFESLETYPFVRLEAAKRAAAARGIRLIDFGMGDPREKTPDAIRQTLIESVPERCGYPPAAGSTRLREAIAGWISHRFGVALETEYHILPSNGSKEIAYLISQALIDPLSDRRVVLIPNPSYPVYEIGARFAGGIPESIPLREGNRFLPDLDAIAPDLYRRTALLWLNYPNNPTGAVAEIDLYRRALALAREYNFWVVSDEAYSEIWFDSPPCSALQVGVEGLLVLNTLSKRSAMTGYRSGLIAGDPSLISLLHTLRPSQGVASPVFVQAAAVAAWGDETHVEAQREIYRAKREILLPVLCNKGLRVVGSEATFYLWVAIPEPESAEQFASRLLEEGVVVTPGRFFGSSGNGYVRIALVPTLADCHEAARILESVL